jgi:hypothetical protein
VKGEPFEAVNVGNVTVKLYRRRRPTANGKMRRPIASFSLPPSIHSTSFPTPRRPAAVSDLISGLDVERKQLPSSLILVWFTAFSAGARVFCCAGGGAFTVIIPVLVWAWAAIITNNQSRFSRDGPPVADFGKETYCA